MATISGPLRYCAPGNGSQTPASVRVTPGARGPFHEHGELRILSGYARPEQIVGSGGGVAGGRRCGAGWNDTVFLQFPVSDAHNLRPHEHLQQKEMERERHSPTDTVHSVRDPSAKLE